MDTTGRELIAAAVHSAAMLVLRQLGHGARQSSTSFSVLALLEREGPTRISALAVAAGLSQPAMTGLVGRLHQVGLVVRSSDPSGSGSSFLFLRKVLSGHQNQCPSAAAIDGS